MQNPRHYVDTMMPDESMAPTVLNQVAVDMREEKSGAFIVSEPLEDRVERLERLVILLMEDRRGRP